MHNNCSSDSKGKSLRNQARLHFFHICIGIESTLCNFVIFRNQSLSTLKSRFNTYFNTKNNRKSQNSTSNNTPAVLSLKKYVPALQKCTKICKITLCPRDKFSSLTEA